MEIIDNAKIVTDPSKPDACQAPMDAGPCKAFKPRWHFNTDKSVCEEFSYGGCRGNTNNFQDEAACVNTCIDGTQRGINMIYVGLIGQLPK